MRLLACSGAGGLSFTKDFMEDDDEGIPPYAILSHTWQPGQEVSFDDFAKEVERTKSGYDKIQFCQQQTQLDRLSHFWIDTCCINKADPVELQDAINSMFRWYHNAAECYVYLWDVSSKDQPSESTWEPAFRRSRWFTRGWTLQELLAPRSIKFFSREGIQLGDRVTLEAQIHEITGISTSALRGTPLETFTVDERLAWVKDRKTTRREDKVYSLLGIFGVFLPPNYGEGEEYAFKRFCRELDAASKDHLHRTFLQRGKVGDAVENPQGL